MPRRSSIAVPFAEDTGTRIAPPDDLAAGSPEHRLFLDLVLSVRTDHFQAGDVPLLSAYCRALALEQTASGELAAQGYITAEGRPSAWLPVLQHATRSITTLGRALRLTPASRLSVPVKEPEPISYYDRMRLEHRDDEPGH